MAGSIELLDLLVVGILALGVLGLVGVGVFFIVRYAQTRRAAFLISGLLLTLVVPGIFLLCLLAVWIPSLSMVYGPPPDLGP